MSVYSENRFNSKKTNDAWFKIFQFVEPNSRILDIGCSSGKLGAALKKEKNVHVTGIDIDKEDVARAKTNLDEAHLMNVETDRLESLGSFDIIIMADVIEHLIDPVSALRKIKPLLNKHGRLVFSIPNMANITTRLELLRGRFEYKDIGLLDRTHLHFYDKQEVNRVFREAGLQVRNTDSTIRDVPETLLRKDLEVLGIQLTPQLKKHLYDTDALVYQFIGYATPESKPHSFEPHTTSPLDSVSREVDRLTTSFSEGIEKKDKEIADLDKRLLDTQNELKNIHNSKGWKALSKFYKVKHYVTFAGFRKR